MLKLFIELDARHQRRAEGHHRWLWLPCSQAGIAMYNAIPSPDNMHGFWSFAETAYLPCRRSLLAAKPGPLVLKYDDASHGDLSLASPGPASGSGHIEVMRTM